jgi:hypothetical protein
VPLFLSLSCFVSPLPSLSISLSLSQYVDYKNGCQRYSKNSTAWYAQYIADHQPINLIAEEKEDGEAML